MQSGVEAISTLRELYHLSKSAESSRVSAREQEILREGGLVSNLFRRRLQVEPLKMLLEFSNGSVDLCHDGNPRSVLVELSCGVGDAIKSIFELSTCNYIIKVSQCIALWRCSFIEDMACLLSLAGGLSGSL